MTESVWYIGLIAIVIVGVFSRARWVAYSVAVLLLAVSLYCSFSFENVARAVASKKADARGWSEEYKHGVSDTLHAVVLLRPYLVISAVGLAVLILAMPKKAS